MKQAIVHIALVVRDYDEAIDFYVNKLGFELLDDTYQAEQDERWVVVAPQGGGTTILLAKASKPEQEPFVGNQAGGRVFLFLNTDDFWRDVERLRAADCASAVVPAQAGTPCFSTNGRGSRLRGNDEYFSGGPNALPRRPTPPGSESGP